MAAATEKIYRPPSLLLQWHLTDRCTHRCAHCYQQAYEAHPSLEELMGFLEQFRHLLSCLRSSSSAAMPAHINLTGGEPFFREDIFDLLSRLNACREEFSVALLSNGSLIDGAAARALKRLSVRFVQLSLEGTPETHDDIRGPGDHARVIRAARALKAAGVPVLFSFTAHQTNFLEFPEVVKWGRKVGVQKVWADRLIPTDRTGFGCRSLTPGQSREFFRLMARCRRPRLLGGPQVSLGRALQFLEGDGRPYACQAGRGLVTVLANGDLCPCRRLPLPVGNLHQQSLTHLYRTSELFERLRRQDSARGCQGCFYEKSCRGGLRCLSQAVTGGFENKDPGCWLFETSPRG